MLFRCLTRVMPPCLLLLVCFLVLPVAVLSQPTPTVLNRSEQQRFAELTIPFAMQGPGILGTAPSRLTWSADGSTVFFRWNPPDELEKLNGDNPESGYDNYLTLQDEVAWYAYDVRSGKVTRMSDDEADATIPSQSAWSRDRTRCAQIRNSDIYLVDLDDGTSRRVTSTLARESRIQISADGERVYFTNGNNLYSMPWSATTVTQLTDIKLSNAPPDKKPSEQREYLDDQQKELFKEFQQEEAEDDEPRIKPIYLGKDWTISGFMVSPSGDYAALEVTKDASGDKSPLVPHFITEDGYMQTRETRSKVGDKQGSTTIRLVDLTGDSLLAVAADEKQWLSARSWSPHDDVLLARGIDELHKSRIFYAVDPTQKNDDGKVAMKVLDAYDDEAWVGGPNFYSTGAWLSDGSGVYFLSEEDGWSHLHTVTLNGKRKSLTSGDWEVHRAYQSLDGASWFLITNEKDPGSRRLWTMKANGSDRRLLTSDFAGYQPTFGPHDKHIAMLRSTIDHPNELYVYDVAAGQLSDAVTESTTEAFRRYKWLWPEIVTIRGSDGGKFRAHIIRPSDFGREPNGAGVVFIHGAGYLQNVTSSWSYYYREYMFNHFLAYHGYTVMNVDFRASAGYGRATRVAIHRHMGGRDLDDIIDAAKYMIRREGIKKEMVGVYGGSYGGFLTIMAMFKYPDIISAGGAIRSVTDWAHYNHWYTSRILGLPTEDPKAYEQSSPIYFAEGFEGGLLMLHGLVDANVLAADVIRLAQVLIDLGKEDWELMLYPLEPHSFRRASSWTDEYKRIYKLFNEELLGQYKRNNE